MKTVMIISDATGETAERMVRAATLQFSEPVQIRLFSRVRLESELEQILEKAAELRALVVFTVVNAEERGLIGKLVERYNLETVDLIGALISKLAMFLGSAPAGVPGLLHSINDEYFRRIEAVEFAVKNDEGAAVDVPRAARPQGRERPARARRRSAGGAVAGRRPQGVRPDRPARHADADPPGAPVASRHAARLELRPARAHRERDRVLARD